MFERETTHAERVAMIERQLAGASLQSIATTLNRVRAKGQRDHLTTRTVQADLRRVFSQSGLPDALRMDRDSIFVGSTRLEWPGVLLWLIGLGVQPIINRAYRQPITRSSSAIIGRGSSRLCWAKRIPRSQASSRRPIRHLPTAVTLCPG